MTRRARSYSLWRRRGAAVVSLVLVTILALVIGAARSIGETTERIGRIAYAVTGTANAHRETMKMEVESRRSDADAMTQIKMHRLFMAQQLRLTLPGLTQRDDPNRHVAEMLSNLAKLDAAIAADANGSPSIRLQSALSELETSLKRVYDTEEARYFDLNRISLEAKTTSERFLLLLALAIAVSGGALLFGMRRSARANLHQKAQELAEALAALRAAQSDRGRLLDETVRASERERVRLAAELHDGPIQTLAALCVRLDRVGRKMRQGSTDEAGRLVESTRDDLGEEVRELRRVMSELRPPALDEDGLGGATRDYVAGFSSRTGCVGTTVIEVANHALSAEQEVVMYRLVQEALTNVTRHSSAEHVCVELRKTDAGVELRVVDDGVGFDVSRSAELVRNGHYGLAGMRERVEAAGGNFSVHSKPGEGVQVVALLPSITSTTTEDDDPAFATAL